MKKWNYIMLFLCFISTGLYSIDLSIVVVDQDLNIPLEGVLITEINAGVTVYTDAGGRAVLRLDDTLKQAIIVAELIGYDDRKLIVMDFTRELVIEMLIQGVLEGEELVVEEEAMGETEEEVGVSTVVEEEVIESASKIGIIEDALHVVKILPGVTYTEAFESDLSVRGGDPAGLTVMLDGFVVQYPYHWGGVFSIFNPNIIESIKFSPGIFSSKYGQATSGIMEVTTVTPNEGARVETIIATSTLDLFLQLPFLGYEKAGVFCGLRLTSYDLVFSLIHSVSKAAENETLLELASQVSRVPYIYDFYVKTFYRPTNMFEWYINGFCGNDGIGIAVTNPDVDTSETIVSDFDFRSFNTDLFVNTGVKILPADFLFIHVLAGYEYWISETYGEIKEYGTQFYSDAFIEEYGDLIPPGDESFTIDTVSTNISSMLKHGVQCRGDFDLTLHKDYLLQWGLGCYLDMTADIFEGDMWEVSWEDGDLVYEKEIYKTAAENSSVLDSFLYVNLNVDIIPGKAGLDVGARLDHSFFIGEEGYTLNTYPVPCPRFNLIFSPDTAGNFFKKNTFSIGAGLFSKNPFLSGTFAQDFDLKDFEMIMPKTLMSVLGWETEVPAGFRFKIEGYYKYIFNLFYINSVYDSETDEHNHIFHNNGIGHVGGFDLLLNRKISRFFDGIFSYTFVYARYKYPETDGLDPETSQRGIWYYPYYHRFHSLNLLLNFKPTNSITITTKMSFATGVPEWEYGEKQMFPASIENEDGTVTVAEMYSRPQYYRDTLRSNFALPLDFKCAYHNYFPNSKALCEVYFAVANILAPLWAAILPADNIDYSKWSGEEQAEPEMTFDIPIPSMGIRISY